jgi:hypothetical protein
VCALQVCSLSPETSSTPIRRVIEECQIREHLRTQRELELLPRAQLAMQSLSVDNLTLNSGTPSHIGRLQHALQGMQHSKRSEFWNDAACSPSRLQSSANIYKLPSRHGWAGPGSSYKTREPSLQKLQCRHPCPKRADLITSNCQSGIVDARPHSPLHPPTFTKAIQQGMRQCCLHI